MPKDKKASHERVLKAAKQVFLEYGYEQASIRIIGERSGMTSAGLYRHCIDKADLFEQVIRPLIEDMRDRFEEHKRDSYAEIHRNGNLEAAFEMGELRILEQLLQEYPEELTLLCTKSTGTKYETFMSELVEAQQVEMQKVLGLMKQKGYPVKEVTDQELHMLLSAYLTAMIEPIIRNYQKEEIEHCLQSLEAFFMPGWKRIMGL